MKEILIVILSSSAFSTLVAIIANALINNNKRKKDDIGTVKEGLKSVLYFQIKSACSDALKEGEIDSETLEAILKSWDIYHNKLGGNGYLDKYISDIKKLPFKKIYA